MRDAERDYDDWDQYEPPEGDCCQRCDGTGSIIACPGQHVPRERRLRGLPGPFLLPWLP